MRVLASLLTAGSVGLFAVTAAAEEPESPAPEEAEEARPAEASEATGAASGDQPAPGDPAGDEEQEDDEEEALPEPIPSATDTLSGHLVISAAGLLSEPFGDLHDGVPQSRAFGTGYGGSLELGYGVSRTVLLGAWGEGVALGEGSACTDCSATSFAFGPFLRYHLVQGVRFDPWISAGLGLRLTKVKASGEKLKYTGVDLLRLQVGGDWYAHENVGLGPFMGLGVGMYASRPDDLTAYGYGDDPGEGIGYSFTVGLRVTLDLPGK